MNDSETKELHKDLKEWFDNRKNQLEKIALTDPDDKLFIENENGETEEVTGPIKEGIQIGCVVAIDILGEFPLEIED